MLTDKVSLRKITCLAALAVWLPAQSIIPTRAGVVSYAEEAYIDERPVDDHYFEVNQNAVLRTGVGRAEVLLGPCAAMWIDDNSSLRMISTALSDMRIEVLAGSVIVDAGAMMKGTKLTLLLKGSVTSLDRKGAYRFDAAPPRVEALAGRTTVELAKQRISVAAGRWLSLGAMASVRKFDKRRSDALDNWSNGRAAFLARLSRQQTNVQEAAPAVTQDDMDNAKRVFVGDPLAKNMPGPLPPMPNSSRSGCGVAAW